MPQSNSEVIKKSLSLGKVGLNSSLQLLYISPLIIGASLLSGAITLPLAGAIMSSMVTLPIYTTASCVAAPVLFEASQRLLTYNMSSLPDNFKPVATQLKDIELKDFDEEFSLVNFVPKAPIEMLSKRLSGVKTQELSFELPVKPQSRTQSSALTGAQMGRPYQLPTTTEFTPEFGAGVLSSDTWEVLELPVEQSEEIPVPSRLSI